MRGQPPPAVRRAQLGIFEYRQLMRTKSILTLTGVLLLASCSPRDFLTRRLATDLIVASDAFNRPQQFVLQMAVVSNKDYVSPEYLVFQQHGWISANTARCSPGLAPPPCWEVLLTPLGVDTVRTLVPADEAGKSSLFIPVARREFVNLTGISKHDNLADVEFTWKWAPLNEVGAALYSGEVHYNSTVGFQRFDDGWRIVTRAPRPGTPLDEALKNAEPAQ